MTLPSHAPIGPAWHTRQGRSLNPTRSLRLGDELLGPLMQPSAPLIQTPPRGLLRVVERPELSPVLTHF